MISKKISLAVNSEEVQDIIGRTPSWVVQKGTIVIAILVLLLIVGARFIRYPDIISAPVKISSANPPVKIIARASGRITELYAKDGNWVDENKIIAVINNPANTNDMLYLKALAESLDTTLDVKNTLVQIALPKNIQAGEIQSDYAALFLAINNYNFFFKNNYYLNKLTSIKSKTG